MIPPSHGNQHSSLQDSFGRTMRDMRISVTDRCNFRCLYCLPETEEAANFYQTRFHPLSSNAHTTPQSPASTLPGRIPWKPKTQLLTFEEILRLTRIATSLGVNKIRLTGGEPLLRRNLEELVSGISSLPGIQDLALTTNGFFFPQKAEPLRKAGLHRVSFSMDSLDPVNFHKITGRDGLKQLLASIRLAQGLGYHPIKVNAVVIREINDHEIEDLASFAQTEGIIMRFIEFMPLDSSRSWTRKLVVPGREILQRLQSKFDLKPLTPHSTSETARRWGFKNSPAEIGVIAPVTEPFCGHCDRIRLTADGQLRTCLFSISEHDFREDLRHGATDESIANRLKRVVWHKEERHHIGERDFLQPARTMSCIGG